jgi:menaquinone-dependent protoporphyrinogen oxidase
MNVLVAYASKHGATTEIAEALGRELCARGIDADVTRAEEVDGVGEYDAVVLGSAVYMGHWLPAAQALADELDGVPVWLFSSGPLGDPPRPEEPPNLGGLEERVHAHGHRVFAGRLRRADLSLPERAIVRMVKAPEGDYRDWDDVAAYADEIAAAAVAGLARPQSIA